MATATLAMPTPSVVPVKPMRPTLGNRPRLDGLRFLAFLGVFIFHVEPAFKHGALGARLFFALSGFLIVRILVLTNIYVFEAGRFLQHIAHFWTLGVEEQFYLAFPLFLFAVPKRRRLAAVVTQFVACKVATIAILWVTDPRPYAGQLPMVAAPPILPGCLAGLWELRKGGRSWHLWLGVLLIAAHSACGRLTMAWPFPLRLLYADVYDAAFALVVLGLWSSSGTISLALAWRPIAYLGSISYGIYVYHVAAIEWAHTIAGDAPLLLGVVAFAGTVLISVMSWHLFESPILRLKSRFPYGASW
jgi:peptidoglycan/LPS O-acetylase OafA/YrhL